MAKGEYRKNRQPGNPGIGKPKLGKIIYMHIEDPPGKVKLMRVLG